MISTSALLSVPLGRDAGGEGVRPPRLDAVDARDDADDDGGEDDAEDDDADDDDADKAC